MSKFRLRSSETSFDEAIETLQKDKKCFINIFDPVGDQASIMLNTRKGSKSGKVLIELDLWRTSCDFSNTGQKTFKDLGYSCGKRVLSTETDIQLIALALDKMLEDLFLAEESCFKEIKL